MTCMIIYFHLEFYYLQKLPWWGRRVEEGIYFSSAFVEWADKLLHAFDCVCRDAHNYQSRYNFRPLFHVPLLLPDCYSITWSLVHVRLFYTLIHSFLCSSFIHSFIHEYSSPFSPKSYSLLQGFSTLLTFETGSLFVWGVGWGLSRALQDV